MSEKVLKGAVNYYSTFIVDFKVIVVAVSFTVLVVYSWKVYTKFEQD